MEVNFIITKTRRLGIVCSWEWFNETTYSTGLAI